ncbi:hypothetical protein ACIQAD_15595 [Streptomyces sp. NPDC088551]
MNRPPEARSPGADFAGRGPDPVAGAAPAGPGRPFAHWELSP